MYSLYIALFRHPVLALLDFLKPLQIESNAPDTAIGCILIQEHASVHKCITFLSKILTSS